MDLLFEKIRDTILAQLPNYNSFREFAKTEAGPILAVFQSKMSKSFSNWCIQFPISWFYSLEYWSERFSWGGGGGGGINTCREGNKISRLM